MDLRQPKAMIWQAFMSLGLEIHIRRDPLRFLKCMDIRTVLDIGANEGQFAAQIRALLPDAKIYSFEPLSAPWLILRNSFAQDQSFEAIQLALGSAPGEAEFEANTFSPSSSFLALNEKYRRNFPHAATTSKTTVPVSTLDLWARGRFLEKNILVKMDVQGYEAEVILGGYETLARSSVVIAETSFVPLYRDQPLYDDIYGMIRGIGFRSAGMVGNSADGETGRILQADSIFIREPANAE